jgi:hypothetical protein
MLKALRAWALRRNINKLPSLSISETANYYKAFTLPNPDYKVNITNSTDELIGTATYAVSPLFDCVYIFDIRVNQSWQRRGYATAFILYLTNKYGLPITAIKELGSASYFWNYIRRLKDVGIIVTDPLSIGEMDMESLRWEHLQHEAERVNKIITDRLTVHRLPWDIATSLPPPAK